ncbi:MAG: hypothetical protein ACI9R3_001533 [Verrucomicrobiales bacterium]|jgi:hypothetical protein
MHPPPIAGQFDEYREEINIQPFAFNFEEELIIEFISHSVGSAASRHPSQKANFIGDLRSTIYFTGFKFYDDLGNQLPDGAYSALGSRLTDWTLSNVPVGIKVIESGRDQDNFTIRFTGPAGEVGWLVKASTDLVAFSLDLTPVSAITETIPGTYEAVIDVSGQGDNLFVRVEREEEAEVPEADLLLKPE